MITVTVITTMTMTKTVMTTMTMSTTIATMTMATTMVITTNNQLHQGCFSQICSTSVQSPRTDTARSSSNVDMAGSACAVVVSQPKTKWMPMDVSASAVDNYLGYELVTLLNS